MEVVVYRLLVFPVLLSVKIASSLRVYGLFLTERCFFRVMTRVLSILPSPALVFYNPWMGVRVTLDSNTEETASNRFASILGTGTV